MRADNMAILSGLTCSDRPFLLVGNDIQHGLKLWTVRLKWTDRPFLLVKSSNISTKFQQNLTHSYQDTNRVSGTNRQTDKVSRSHSLPECDDNLDSSFECWLWVPMIIIMHAFIYLFQIQIYWPSGMYDNKVCMHEECFWRQTQQ